jgi:hypothetical protein
MFQGITPWAEKTADRPTPAAVVTWPHGSFIDPQRMVTVSLYREDPGFFEERITQMS